MKKTCNRGICFLLICIMLLAFVTPLQSVANANNEPVNYLDVLQYAETIKTVGEGYDVAQDENGLTITLTETHYGDGDFPTSCNDPTTLEILDPGSYSSMLTGKGEEYYVSIPVNQLFHIAEFQNLALDISAASGNSDYAGATFSIWYEAYPQGERYCSNRYLANIQEYLDGQTAIDEYGNYFGEDISYSGTEFLDYIVEKGRTDQFKIIAVILKIVGEEGDSFTFHKLSFGSEKSLSEEEKPLVYNFAVLYEFFNTGDHDSDWHNRANVDSDITYERVKEYNKGFDRYIVQG